MCDFNISIPIKLAAATLSSLESGHDLDGEQQTPKRPLACSRVMLELLLRGNGFDETNVTENIIKHCLLLTEHCLLIGQHKTFHAATV